MRRIVQLSLISLFAFSLTAIASSPNGFDCRLVLDHVADGLCRYRMAKSSLSRIDWLQRLAPTLDPRVAMTLCVALTDDDREVVQTAADNILKYYAKRWDSDEETRILQARGWWKLNWRNLCEKAKHLPGGEEPTKHPKRK